MIASNFLRPMRVSLSRRFNSTESVHVATPYPGAVQAMHWIMGSAILGCIGFVQIAKNTKGKTKGNMMFLHKSCGLLAAGLLVPRLAVRYLSKMPPSMSSVTWEKYAANATHLILYSTMIIMPVSGVAMGYYGGRGLPFFYTTLKGAEEKNNWIAGNAFKIHSLSGQVMEYTFLAHLGGVAFHFLRGEPILSRIVPFLKPK